MKKTLIALCSLIVCFLITCTTPLITITTDTYILTSDDVIMPRTICSSQDSIVTVLDTQNNVSASGVSVYKSGNEYYIATTYSIYNPEYVYEIVFSDYARYGASILGYSKDDGVIVFKTVIRDRNYCIANTSGNLKTYVGDKVDVLARENFQNAMAQTHVNAVGVCKNCGEETYKNYFYSRITLEVKENFLGAGIFNLNSKFVGMVTGFLDDYNYGVAFIDSNRVLDIITKLVHTGKYDKNFIKYNLLSVYELSEREKFLYSVSDEVSRGVLVSSLHYVNYFTLGLNQGMVILSVNGEDVDDVFEFDYEISKYKKGSYLDLKVRTIVGLYRTIKVKI